jgi:hypothetical protein
VDVGLARRAALAGARERVRRDPEILTDLLLSPIRPPR